MYCTSSHLCYLHYWLNLFTKKKKKLKEAVATLTLPHHTQVSCTNISHIHMTPMMQHIFALGTAYHLEMKIISQSEKISLAEYPPSTFFCF